jgi:ubiquinone/menaquinone biosynthesis C-methylase UbiE
MKKDFNDKKFTELYIKKHKKLLDKLGYMYAQKLRNLGFSEGMVLDVGCGFGAMCAVVAQEIPGSEVVGVDLSIPMLEYANDRITGESIEKRVSFREANVEKMPFESNSFDVVFNINMVHWVDEPVSMLDEMQRVLKPEGYLFIKDLRRSWLRIFEREINNALTLEEAKELIEDSELREGSFSSSLLWWNFEA